MARYTEKLQALLDNGSISQEDYDELADLSAAKDAIKEFNNVVKERDELKGKVDSFETAPLRKETLRQVGIEYDDVPLYGQEALNSIPADKLSDLDFVAQYVQEKGFSATLPTQEQRQGDTGAERITQATVDMGSGTPNGKLGVVTPADFAAWEMPKQRDFMKRQPQAYEALQRGEEART